MDLTSLETVRLLCRKYRVWPQKRMGQNFLIDRNVLDKIVAAAGLEKDDIVLEIGPGFGALTRELAKRVKRVVAVEADQRLAAALRETVDSFKNVDVVEGDILRFQISDFRFQNLGYKIVANLPYRITSAVFRKFLENEPRPSEMTVMVQKEVAERICAKSGEMSLLSVSVQFFGEPEIVGVMPRAAFWPEPEVESAILRIIVTGNKYQLTEAEQKKFFQIVRIGFSSRRKQLQNNLSSGLRLSNKEVRRILLQSGFDPKIRAQELGIADWLKLIRQFIE